MRNRFCSGLVLLLAIVINLHSVHAATFDSYRITANDPLDAWIAEDLLIGRNAEGSETEGSGSVISGRSIVSLPAKGWALFPVLAGLLIFVRRSARKTV